MGKIILALETTEKFGSIALLDDTEVLAETILPKDQRSSQTLHPALQLLFQSTKIASTEIDVVAVVAGPGSFTGLRVGVTAAKMFAYTSGAKVIALDTFQTVAAALQTHPGPISVGVDAQRGEVVVAVLSAELQPILPVELISVEEWWKHADLFENVLFAGPALERYGSKVPAHLDLASEANWFPKASIAGKLAAERVFSEQYDDVWSLLPIYSRLSAAEERRGG